MAVVNTKLGQVRAGAGVVTFDGRALRPKRARELAEALKAAASIADALAGA